MKKSGKKALFLGIGFVVTFVMWTVLILLVDVKPTGLNGTNIGFASLNQWFHKMTGVHMMVYSITDWLGLIPVFICMIFGGIGVVQLINRRSFFKVDYDIIILGIYYVVVILGYLVFEMIPINYRPILIEGRMAVSYPSSTTLLVLCVMPTLMEQAEHRVKNVLVKRLVSIFTVCFSSFMVLGRLVSGVHWFTDIVGGMLLSAGLFYIYKAAVILGNKKEEK